jgi:Ca-activated chloride channel family protein
MNTSMQSNQEPQINIRRERKYRPLEGGPFHILTTLIAPPVARDAARQRPPLDLAFIVDRSGSMGNGALDLAREGVEHALRLLDERDSASLIVYDDRIETLLTQRRFDADARSKAIRRLRRIQPRGSTDLAGGWLTGCNEIAPIADGSRLIRSGEEHPICRALLLTDGLANVGMTAPDELATHASELRRRGITTTTFGVGGYYDEELLAAMADAGGGHFHHIPHASAIPQVFAGELGEMLDVALRDATIALRVPHGWNVHLLNDLPVERDDNWLLLRLGEMFSNDSRSHVWAVELPAASHGHEEAFDIRLRWSDATGTHTFEQRLSHIVTASHSPGEPDGRVAEAMAQQMAARARYEAVRFNKRGDYAGAREVLMRTRMAMPQHADAQIVAEEILADVDVLSAPASPIDQKRLYSKARHAQRSRRDYAEDTPQR